MEFKRENRLGRFFLSAYLGKENRKEGAAVLEMLDPLRELNTLSVLLRMVLAMLFGGLIGLERGRKRRRRASGPICW